MNDANRHLATSARDVVASRLEQTLISLASSFSATAGASDDVALLAELGRECFEEGTFLRSQTLQGMRHALGALQPGHEIFLVHGNASWDMRVSRMAHLERILESLTPEMRSNIGAVDFRKLSAAQGFAGIGYVRIGRDDQDGSITYHEIAHLRTLRILAHKNVRQEWELLAGSAFEHRSQNAKEARQHGLISLYAATNYAEDISELTAAIYASPTLVKKAMEDSPIFAQKVQWLYDHQFIRDDQYQYLMHNQSLPRTLLTEEGEDVLVERAVSSFGESLGTLFWRAPETFDGSELISSGSADASSDFQAEVL